MHYTYLLKSKKNNQLYVGSTNDLRKRIEDHNKGKVFSTARYLPWEILYYKAYSSEKLARIREKRLKYNGNALRELKKRIGLLPLKLKSGAGFTLIELMIVVVLIILVSAFTLPVGFNFYQESTLKDQARNLENSLREAQAMAMTGREESGTGVTIFPEKEQYVIFEGESYEKGRDEITVPFAVSLSVSVSGIDEGENQIEIIFQKSTGLPVLPEGKTSITITLTLGANSQAITINSQGRIERYEPSE